MLESLIPFLIKGAVDLFTSNPETAQEVVKTAAENPMATALALGAGAGAAISVPMLVSKYLTGKLIPIQHLDEVLMVARKVIVPTRLATHYLTVGQEWLEAFIEAGEKRLKEKRKNKDKGG